MGLSVKDGCAAPLMCKGLLHLQSTTCNITIIHPQPQMS